MASNYNVANRFVPSVIGLAIDGQPELVVKCEFADGDKSGVFYFRRDERDEWKTVDIGGPEGVKYDLIELVDLDGDRDLDVLTCEERDNPGVIWYENPGRT